MENFEDIEGPHMHDLNAEIGEVLLQIHEGMTVLFLRIKHRFFHTAVHVCMLLLLLWMAIFLYVTLYYTFMPNATFITPVHFYYRSDDQSVCSFPMANFSLLQNGKKQVITHDQPYQITLELEMPESPANMQLGMFLVKMSCYSNKGAIIGTSVRSTMLQYRSYLLQTLETLIFFPLMLMGTVAQKQNIQVELYASYTDSSDKPTVGAIIEIQSQQVQIYKAQLYIYAHFSGIRYLLYHFPLSSAVVGVLSNFIFIIVVIFISYLHYGLSSDWPYQQLEKFNTFLERKIYATDQYEANSTGIKSPLLDASIVGSSDITDFSSDQMEASYSDRMVEENHERNHLRDTPGKQSRSKALDGQNDKKHGYLSEDLTHLSLPPSEYETQLILRGHQCNPKTKQMMTLSNEGKC